MSDMHVMTGNGRGWWTIIMHFPVSDADNSVGVNWRIALINSRASNDPEAPSSLSSMVEGVGPGQITTAELAQVEAGELFEYPVSFLVESGGTSPSELRAALRDKYAKEESDTIDRLKLELKYFGHTEEAI